MPETTQELGPLPEPAATRERWHGDGGWHQWHDELHPLPDEWEDPPDVSEPYYTADQMRAYALQERAAERERCARLAEDHECGGADDIVCQRQNCGTCIAGRIRESK